ncbi:ABC transporter permease [Streptomyces bambusae]|uniref:ABC transporter permease n=1 Tax=Streptomyces bambusae TaxID=1550616 RepID=UPI001CFF04CB|nr:ABC transporter permease [Streptomyces bambusae]MCB5165401.1 ABC transporter permease [Streptomyces bambusae]
MTGFIFLRAGAHRLLLAAALLAVLLTTCVLAALAAFSGSVGDAALRETLRGRAAAAAALVVTADVAGPRRDAAQQAAERGARETFAGLPVTLRKMERSGPYALPRSLRAASDRTGDPDLTHLAALDRSRVVLVAGALPGPAPADRRQPVPVALPAVAADLLKVRPGARISLTDRLSGGPLTVQVTGVYKAADTADPYWQLDPVGGRGMRKLVFTTYGPLLADPSALAPGRVAEGSTGWLATADFAGLTTDRIGALKAAAVRGPERLDADPAFAGKSTSVTGLPVVLERTEQALLVARSTLLMVAVQLVLLAGYALLLVARLLSVERSGETSLLRARGASRGRIAGLAAVEALLLAVPAAVVAPLAAGPLAGRFAPSALGSASGLRLGAVPPWPVWLVAAGVAACCAVAVVSPALAAAGATVRLRRMRGGSLPGPVRAGADVALLLVAGVAYWQLQRQTGSGVLSGDREGDLGVDPLLVAAPALALLAGTVVTLRLLPPAARLAERRAAGGRGLVTALAGWQFSRRPLRGAGPVLLLVLAVSMGMLAIGQGASWDRSQRDQADFRTGASVRVLDARPGGLGRAGEYAAAPGVRAVAPAHRASVGLPGSRTGTVVALDTAHAQEGLLLRPDLAGGHPDAVLRAVAPDARQVRPVLPLPAGTRQLAVDVRLSADGKPGGRSPSGLVSEVALLLTDGHGLSHRVEAGRVPVDGRPHRVTVDLGAAGAGAGRKAGPGTLELTGLRLASAGPEQDTEFHRLRVERLLAAGPAGGLRPLTALPGLKWQGVVTSNVLGEGSAELRLEPGASSAAALLDMAYQTGSEPRTGARFAVRFDLERPAGDGQIAAVATDAFLRASGARPGQDVDVELAGQSLRVKVVRAVRELPTGGLGATDSAAAPAAADGGALLLDLRAVNAALLRKAGTPLPATEWWLSAAPGASADLAEVLRARPGTEPGQVLVRAETAAGLLGDPLGAGPRAALLAVAVAAALLAAVGFAVSAAGSLRERSAEIAVLRALGAPQRGLARMVAAEQGVLIALGLLAGTALGTALARAVVPLVVLTAQAAAPVPEVLVELPVSQVALLLAGVAAVPLLLTAAVAVRRTDPAVSLRHQGEN